MNGQCEYVIDGTDTDSTVWYRCTTHEELAPSQDAPCAGYQEIPYTPAGDYADVLAVKIRGHWQENISDSRTVTQMIAQGVREGYALGLGAAS